MSDLYHPKVPFSFIDRVFGVMSAASDHVFQILTKRPERMVDYFSEEEEELIERWANVCPVDKRPEFPLRNVWLGTSVENDATKHRIDDLRQVKAEVRFVSFEPLVGKVENVNLEEMDWVIVGGESGHDAAPMEASWAISIRDECKRNDIPFFFKQWGGKYSKENGRELDGKIYSEMPKNTRLAEYA